MRYENVEPRRCVEKRTTMKYCIFDMAICRVCEWWIAKWLVEMSRCRNVEMSNRQVVDSHVKCRNVEMSKCRNVEMSSGGQPHEMSKCRNVEMSKCRSVQWWTATQNVEMSKCQNVEMANLLVLHSFLKFLIH